MRSAILAKKAIRSYSPNSSQNVTIDNLIALSLLETDQEGKYWLHPLVREFATMISPQNRKSTN